MPTLSYNYVYFASGPHLRQPRTISGSGGFTLLESIAGGSPATGGTFVAGAQPATLVVNGITYAFAFVNITGGTPSGQTSFQSNVPPPAITVGTAPINVLIVYVPTGPGGGGSGATIDAFDESTGTLFNDTFVTVAPDPGGTLTTSGNVEGYVSTANAETITALSVTSPTGVDFDRWAVLAGGGTANGNALALAAGAWDSALAFYKTPPPAPVEPPAEVSCDQTVASLQQMVLLGPNGPLFTVTQWTAVQASLHKCVLEGYLTQAKANQLIAEYEAYAHNHGAAPHPPIHVI